VSSPISIPVVASTSIVSLGDVGLAPSAIAPVESISQTITNGTLDTLASIAVLHGPIIVEPISFVSVGPSMVIGPPTVIGPLGIRLFSHNNPSSASF